MKEGAVMEEKRHKERLEEYNEITTTIINEDGNPVKEKNYYVFSKDISATGARIQGNIPLPIDTLLKINFKLKNLHKKVTVFGKVKWTKTIIENTYYQAGVEFVDTPDDVISKLFQDHNFWKE